MNIAIASINLFNICLAFSPTLETLSLTLFITVLIAKIVGCVLPIIAKRIGLDPAVMASPFITTIVDAIALLVYFSIAVAVLGI